jgi:hypothetical protein
MSATDFVMLIHIAVCSEPPFCRRRSITCETVAGIVFWLLFMKDLEIIFSSFEHHMICLISLIYCKEGVSSKLFICMLFIYLYFVHTICIVFIFMLKVKFQNLKRKLSSSWQKRIKWRKIINNIEYYMKCKKQFSYTGSMTSLHSIHSCRV